LGGLTGAFGVLERIRSTVQVRTTCGCFGLSIRSSVQMCAGCRIFAVSCSTMS
jgi:uncharacterized Fe-S cluster-containing radical SAM superfamily enzyme